MIWWLARGKVLIVRVVAGDELRWTVAMVCVVVGGYGGLRWRVV